MTTELTKQLTDAIAPILECQTSEELIGGFDELTQRLGFSIASYQLIQPIGWYKMQGPVILFVRGYPDEARSSYVNKKLYTDDPLFKYATRTGEAFWWKDLDKLTDLTKRQKSFMAAFGMSGLGNGLSVPTYGPNGRNGYFGFSRGSDTRFGPDNLGQVLQLYCQTLHARYCSLTCDNQKKVSLSSKEIEVMTNVVHGLSTNQIAENMGVSSNTVNTHLKRIYAKMNVQDRVSATLKFLASGQIYK